MSDLDDRHGTYAGYQVGCRQECCRAAARDYQRQRYFDHRVLDLPPRCVDKTGTERRVHALQRIGWSAEDMSVMLGRSPAFLNVTINRDARRGVNYRTAKMVSDLYDRLSMKLGPSERTRARAEQRGWLPPLAWDDIDDPFEQPETVSERTNYRAQDLLAEWHHLRASGESIHQAARQLGVTVDAIEKAGERVAQREAS